MEYEGLIDPKILQRLQDYFCQANGIYLACVGRQLGVLTKAYGSRAEREFVHSMVDKDTYMSLLKKLQSSSVENVIEEPVDFNFIRMAGITTRLEDGSQLSWVAIGVIKDNIPEGFELPEGIMSTSEEKFYHAIEFLEVVTTSFVQAKVEEKKAQDDMKEKSDLEAKTESELKKNAAIPPNREVRKPITENTIAKTDSALTNPAYRPVWLLFIAHTANIIPKIGKNLLSISTKGIHSVTGCMQSRFRSEKEISCVSLPMIERFSLFLITESTAMMNSIRILLPITSCT